MKTDGMLTHHHVVSKPCKHINIGMSLPASACANKLLPMPISEL